jgi:hypothetical protein
MTRFRRDKTIATLVGRYSKNSMSTAKAKSGRHKCRDIEGYIEEIPSELDV